VEKPLVLEFASPIKGTYPLWYDAPYWYAGAKVHFDLRRLLTAVKENVLLYKDLVLSPMAAFIAGAIVLYVCLLNGNIYPALPRQLWWQLAWPVTAFSMFALVHVEGRFLGGLLVLFWLAVYGALALRSDGQITVAVCATVLGTVMIPLAFHVARLGTYIPGELLHPRPSECQIAASGLRNLGLQDGSRVAVVGTVDNAYYARCARLRVIAQIPNQQEFWRMSAPELRAAEERLTSVGVEALVAANRPNSPAVAAWKDVQASDSLQLNVRVLSPQVLPRD
jgi:hypothetical protein